MCDFKVLFANKKEIYIIMYYDYSLIILVYILKISGSIY